jgi:hypothetical protein
MKVKLEPATFTKEEIKYHEGAMEVSDPEAFTKEAEAIKEGTCASNFPGFNV